MGCGSSKIHHKRGRSSSQVTIDVQQRAVAAYRRQRIAREREQNTYLRAEYEVEKALIIKRNSLCSVDERRPSYVQRMLEDLAETHEEGEEAGEATEDYTDLNIDERPYKELRFGDDVTDTLVKPEQNQIDNHLKPEIQESIPLEPDKTALHEEALKASDTPDKELRFSDDVTDSPDKLVKPEQNQFDNHLRPEIRQDSIPLEPDKTGLNEETSKVLDTQTETKCIAGDSEISEKEADFSQTIDFSVQENQDDIECIQEAKTVNAVKDTEYEIAGQNHLQNASQDIYIVHMTETDKQNSAFDDRLAVEALQNEEPCELPVA